MLKSIPLAIAIVLSGAGLAAAQTCGYSPNDWCTSAQDGPCGRHRDAASCRADATCRGMEYRGESAIACLWDENGFAENCPTVGCLDR